MNNQVDRRSTEWDFYGTLVKIGLPLGLVVALFILARGGDVTAIVLLVTLGAVVLIGLGLVAALAILDRMARLEQMRMAENTRENLALMAQQQRILTGQIQAQGRLSRDVLTANQQLTRLLPDGRGDPLDVDALVWDDDALLDLELGGR